MVKIFPHFTCLRSPLFLCTGVCRPSAPHPTTCAWPSAWPEPPSSSAAPTCRPWCECCTSAGSSPPPKPGLSGSRQPAVCRLRRASGSHGRSSSECHCPAETQGDGRSVRTAVDTFWNPCSAVWCKCVCLPFRALTDKPTAPLSRHVDVQSFSESVLARQHTHREQRVSHLRIANEAVKHWKSAAQMRSPRCTT